MRAHLAVRTIGVMLCVAALAGCDLAMVAVSAQGARGTFTRSLTVDGPVDLTVRTGSGDIVIRQGTTDRVEVTGKISASGGDYLQSMTPAERVRAVEADPPVVQEGNAITIGGTRDRRAYNNVSISYEITVPPHTTLNTMTGSGNHEIGRVEGSVRARAGSGSIRVQRTGGALHAQAGSGDIHASEVAGELDAQTGSGDITVAQVGRAGVRVQAGSGDVDLDLPDDAGYTLDLRSGSGSISTRQQVVMQGRMRRNHVQGTVRGGGSVVKIQTGSGSIEIR